MDLGDESEPLVSFRRGVAWKKLIAILAIVFTVITIVILLLTSVILSAKLVDLSNDSVPDLDLCAATDLQYDPFYGGAFKTWSKPSFLQNATTYLLKNGTIWTMNPLQPVLYNADILIEDGIIESIGIGMQNNEVPNIPLNGRWVTPGLVDLHSHLGVYAYPEDANANSDGNELTGPTLPFIRSLDALNPEDPAIPLVRSGGITSSLILPGSGNVMGGEATIIKLHSSSNIRDLLIPNAPRALKMACGENPKNVYGSRGVLPMSRMGIGYLVRKRFFEAAQFLQTQKQWDCLSNDGKTAQARPFSLEYEPLIAVLLGEARLNVHCYETQDLSMMIRASQEFNFTISAFHHALEAWKMPEELANNNISAAIFADHWGFKMEGYDGSVWAAKILQDAGVNVVLKTDHPVIFAKDFIYEAIKASFYGLDDQTSMESVTKNAAVAMGLFDSIGSIELGKAADIVVWDRYPLNLGATPDQVYIDGKQYVARNAAFTTTKRVIRPDQTMISSGPNICPTTTDTTSASFAVQNVNIYTQVNNTIITNGVIVVTNGTVTCVGTTCTPDAGATIFSFPVENGVTNYLIPSFVNGGSDIGLKEVDQEYDTQDGIMQGSDYITLANILAYDGLKLNNWQKRHLTSAFKGGVTNLITKPQGTTLVTGVGVAYHSLTDNTQLNDYLISKKISLHITIGNEAKSGPSFSVSAQINQLKELFWAAQVKNASNTTILDSDPFKIFVDVLNGVIPLVVHTNGIDDILKVVNFKIDFAIPNVLIMGGSEAFRVASILAQNNIAVVLAPPRRPPNTFDSNEWDPTYLSILITAGVKVGLSILEPGDVRNLRWEAGMAMASGQVDFDTALRMVTLGNAEIFGISGVNGIGAIEVGQRANFVVTNGNPLTTEGKIQLVALGTNLSCYPRQY